MYIAPDSSHVSETGTFDLFVRLASARVPSRVLCSFHDRGLKKTAVGTSVDTHIDDVGGLYMKSSYLLLLTS